MELSHVYVKVLRDGEPSVLVRVFYFVDSDERRAVSAPNHGRIH